MKPTPFNVVVVTACSLAVWACLATIGVQRDDRRRRARRLREMAAAWDAWLRIMDVYMREAHRAVVLAGVSVQQFGESLRALSYQFGRAGARMCINNRGSFGEQMAFASDAHRVAAIADEELAAWDEFIAGCNQ